MVTEDDLAKGRVYPALSDIRNVSIKLAEDLGEYVYKHDLASHYPPPGDIPKFIRSHLYNTEYESFIPECYDWPKL